MANSDAAKKYAHAMRAVCRTGFVEKAELPHQVFVLKQERPRSSSGRLEHQADRASKRLNRIPQPRIDFWVRLIFCVAVPMTADSTCQSSMASRVATSKS